jgi:pimeloyl-ACP methyl ester carboxylesterase
MPYADSLIKGTLDVPGAHLCYEVRGSGPALLLIPGGPADAAGFERVASLLASDYSVITYDPRGLSRSSVHDPEQDISVTVQADDAHRLLEAVTSEPAYVFGSSGGAITGLALVARYPAQIRTLIAHEPPVIELLPDRDVVVAQNQEVYRTYLRQGAGPAMMKFMAMAGFDVGEQPDPTDDPAMREAIDRMRANLDLFFGRMYRGITGYRPDINALRAAGPRLQIACGMTSAGQLAHRTAIALAGTLGMAPVQFPGDHGGYATDPEKFAQTLRQVLAG